MADSGGTRFDIDADQHITPGEVRTIRFSVSDGDGDAIADFSGWAFEWFLTASSWIANGVTALRDVALVVKADADIESGTAPVVDVPLVELDLTGLAGGTYWHELWRVDAGNVRRLSYGDFAIIG